MDDHVDEGFSKRFWINELPLNTLRICDLRHRHILCSHPIEDTVRSRYETAISVFRTFKEIAFICSGVLGYLHRYIVLIGKKECEEVISSIRCKQPKRGSELIVKGNALCGIVALQLIERKILSMRSHDAD